MMRIRMWMVLAFFCVFIKGVSFSNNCSVIRVISFVPGESITLDVDEDGVEESTLVDGSGTDIARINKSGALTILDERYKDKISAKGFSFHVQDATIKDQMNFTLSVVYKNGSHCSLHYLVKKKEKSKLEVEGPPNCREKTQIVYRQPDHSFTLGFESAEVDEITWVDERGKHIAVTKAKSQILDTNYEGNFSPISVILRKSNATPTAPEHYSGIVSFCNGTRCLQRYLVTSQGPPNCREKTQTVYRQPDHSFTLGFVSAEVDEITWVDTKAVTKAKLQILDTDYEGNFSLIGVTLRKSNATPTAPENHTGIVSFRNGTKCLQHYLVTSSGFEWYAWFLLPLFALTFIISHYCFTDLVMELSKRTRPSRFKEQHADLI